MRVLQIGESLTRAFGGTAAACAHLANHLTEAGVDVSVMTLGEGREPDREWPLDPRVVAKVGHRSGPSRLGYAADAGVVLDSLTPQDLMHLHGLWRLHYVQAARFAERRDIPLVVSVHGMLHAAALRQRGSFKRAARWIFQDALLHRARCLHATATQEADEIRRAGFDGPIAVVPWGVDVPDRPAHSVDPAATARRTALYLGRLHPSKGLEPLLRAWARVQRRFPAWHLLLAGYDEGGYRATLETRAAELGLADAVTFTGPSENGDRDRLFAHADLVVLPSPAENFGLVVPEALACGVPVIATKGSPWPGLAAEDCGWWIPVGDEPLKAALDDALGRTPENLRAMGDRGRRLAREQFAWDRVTGAMMHLYGWVLGRGPQPDFVERQRPS
jgi:glycosyltransferase involved in cell wall biosynthesis